jgi:lactoylglutathione lyase
MAVVRVANGRDIDNSDDEPSGPRHHLGITESVRGRSSTKEVPMLPIRGVYEIAIPVADLARAERFYREILGLEVGLRDDARRWLFLRAGGEAGMVVLQETPAGFPSMHFAFTVDGAEIDEAASQLVDHGVAVAGPHHHAWMPATSVYFEDPDGHQLELCAPGTPRVAGRSRSA